MSFVIRTVTGLGLEASPFVAVAYGVVALVSFDPPRQNPALDGQAPAQPAFRELPDQGADPPATFNAMVDIGPGVIFDDLEAFLDQDEIPVPGSPTDRGAFVVVKDLDVHINAKVARNQPRQLNNGTRCN